MVRLLVDLYIELIFILSSVGLGTPDKYSNIVLVCQDSIIDALGNVNLKVGCGVVKI